MDSGWGYCKGIWKPKASMQAVITRFSSFYMDIERRIVCRETTVALQWETKSAATS